MGKEELEDGLVMPDENEEELEVAAEEDDDELNESKIWGGVDNDDDIYLAKAKENKPNDGLDEDTI